MEKKRIRSGKRPFYAALAVLVYAVLFGLGSLLSYIGAAVVFYIGYKVLKKKYRDRTVTVERAPHSGDEGCDALILEGREALLKIRDANARIPDPELSRRIDSIEESCRQIFKRLEEQPKLQQNLRSFLRYYLPTTLKLLEARAQLDSGAQSQTARDVRRRTSEALAMVDDAFKKQLAALDEYRFLDLETEMDVLNSMLRQDGFVQPEAYAGAGTSGGAGASGGTGTAGGTGASGGARTSGGTGTAGGTGASGGAGTSGGAPKLTVDPYGVGAGSRKQTGGSAVAWREDQRDE